MKYRCKTCIRIHDNITYAGYYDPNIGGFLTQDSYRGEIREASTWNLYQYCHGNPINYTDPTGHKAKDVRSSITAKTVSIYIGVHLVMLGQYHTSIHIVAQPKSKFYKHKYFEKSTKDQKYSGSGKTVKYATIGAGPKGFPPKLVSSRNRPEDVKLNNKAEMIFVKSYTDTTMVNRLFMLERNYRTKSKKVNYALQPVRNGPVEGPGYNSNSFVSGLLIAAGIHIPRAPKKSVPGFSVPMARYHFGFKTISPR